MQGSTHVHMYMSLRLYMTLIIRLIQPPQPKPKTTLKPAASRCSKVTTCEVTAKLLGVATGFGQGFFLPEVLYSQIRGYGCVVFYKYIYIYSIYI